MDKEKLNRDLEGFLKDPNNYDPVEFHINLEGRDAYAYRLSHLMLENSDLDQSVEEINRQIFLTGLLAIEEKTRTKVSNMGGGY